MADIVDAIKTVNSQHRYVADNGDSWNITAKGDCEDYSLAVVWEYSGRSWPGFIKNVLFGPFRFHYVTVKGDGHFVTQYRDKYFDNAWRALVPREWMEANYKFKKTYFKLTVLLRTILT